jgi:hypothetical protein
VVHPCIRTRYTSNLRCHNCEPLKQCSCHKSLEVANPFPGRDKYMDVRNGAVLPAVRRVSWLSASHQLHVYGFVGWLEIFYPKVSCKNSCLADNLQMVDRVYSGGSGLRQG